LLAIHWWGFLIENQKNIAGGAAPPLGENGQKQRF